MFSNFIEKVPSFGKSFICIDNKNNNEIIKKIKIKNYYTYGTSINSQFRIRNIEQSKEFSKFNVDIKLPGKKDLTIKNIIIPLLGLHNIRNATAAIAVATTLGISKEIIKNGLKGFKGVQRRFNKIFTYRETVFFDDYAHHPTEIKATYEIAKSLKKMNIIYKENEIKGILKDTKVKWKNIIVVFQPHRFSRTKNLYNDFIEVLKKIDVLYILDIYPAGEKSIKGVNSQKLVKDLKKNNSQVYYLKKNTNINKILSSYYNKKNLIIFLGAGSITHEAHKIVKKNCE